MGVAGDSKSNEPMDLQRPCFCSDDFGNVGVGVVTIEGGVIISDFTLINAASVRRLPLVGCCTEDRFVVGSWILMVGGGNNSSSTITLLLLLNRCSSCGLRMLPLLLLLALVGEGRDVLCLSLLLDHVWYLTK